MHDVDDFPPGCRVMLPSGRTGVVVKHKGWGSRLDPFMRVLVKIDGEGRQGMVQLQPQHLVRLSNTRRPHEKMELTA